MKYALFKIKQGREDQWKQWCDLVSTTFKEEAERTIKDENLVFEGALIFEIDETSYTLLYMQEDAGGAKPSDKTNTLNIEHNKNKRECLEPVAKGQSVFFLSAKGRPLQS